MEKNYNLNNPMDRARLIIDALKLYKEEEVIVYAPACLTYRFDNVVEGIMWVIHHTVENDVRSVFLNCTLDNPYRSVGLIKITTSYGEYKVNPMQLYKYKYVPSEDEYFRNDEKAKIDILNREFSSQFSQQELEVQRVNQALEILNVNDSRSLNVSKKIERLLNKYFQDRWTSYTVEREELDSKSVQYTLKVKYDTNQEVTLFN